MGISHETLVWDHGGAPGGNLMAAAREARMRLLAEWAARSGVGAVALGHTADDQAETLLMRLMRGAGVDGLSAMPDQRESRGVCWLRPMLALRRPALRAWLTAQGIAWIDDPTNDNPDFDRIRARQTITALDLPVTALARSAAHLAEARDALGAAALAAAAGFTAGHGALWLPPAALDQPPELRRRLMVAAIRWVNGADYAPRGEAVGRVHTLLAQGRQATLDGVILRPDGGGIQALREPVAARRSPALTEGGIWDRRWRIAPLPPGATVTAPSDADLAGTDWRALGLARRLAAGFPCLTLANGERRILISGDARALPLRDADDFAALLTAR